MWTVVAGLVIFGGDMAGCKEKPNCEPIPDVIKSYALADVPGECDMAGLYRELGCTAVPAAPAAPTAPTAPATTAPVTCPAAFDCPDLHPDKGLCYYRGKSYPSGSALPDAAVRNPCSRACACAAPRFACAAVDCVETFGDRQLCVATQRLGECCASGSVCGRDAIANLTTCEVDGRTYREGESFQPPDSRSTCVCAASGRLECADIDCGVEIHYQAELMDNCAPVFANNARSCPIDFLCPSTDTAVVKGVNTKGVSAACNFGNQTLTVGDMVTAGDKCMKCSCLVPPLVTCVLASPCEA